MASGEARPRHDHAGAAVDQGGEGESAGQTGQKTGHHRRDVLAGGQARVDQMGQNFTVGLAFELTPGGAELGGQFAVIFDDAVMHQGDLAGDVGVGVGFGWPAMGGPAGVADAGLAGERRGGQRRGQMVKLTGPPQAFETTIGGHRYPGRVIAAIFQAAQPVEQTRGDRRPAEDANQATHRPISPSVSCAPTGGRGSAVRHR